ncbi:MAG: tRNA-binding protein [Deltaproteobacteria bacterium]|nr:tRNA-binding protein [Deltaproteobacteria bacterium]
MSKEISCETFAEVDLRIGTIIRAEAFPEARKPAIKVWADFGPEIGVKKSSAQITKAYAPETLPGRQILGVVNFPPRQIGPFRSEFLLTGFAREDGAIILAVPDLPAPNGARLI